MTQVAVFPDEKKAWYSKYRSNKLILAGGLDYNITKIMEEKQPSNVVLSDLYTFDTETYVWAKIADTPVGYYEAACAVSGDSLILYGGYKHHYYPFESGEQDQIFNDITPSIYNLKENTWVTTYTPSFDSVSS
ncbi:hypothetical protein BGZ92_010063 [Podila epicladia]|nr:hypothetical protein BGZ92_010063 [Podila epicladia]